MERGCIVLTRLVRNESGISLPELMVAGAMASLIAAAFLVIFASFSRNISLEERRAAALSDVQWATAELATELRQAVGLDTGGSPVALLTSNWPAPEIVFYSDRADALGPERYRYYVAGCSGNLCDLHREVTVADAGGPPWTFTGAGTSELVVANVLSDGDILFQGADWRSGAESLTTSCGSSSRCDFDLVKVVIRVDPDPNLAAEEPLQVRHELRLRNAG